MSRPHYYYGCDLLAYRRSDNNWVAMGNFSHQVLAFTTNYPIASADSYFGVKCEK